MEKYSKFKTYISPGYEAATINEKINSRSHLRSHHKGLRLFSTWWIDKKLGQQPLHIHDGKIITFVSYLTCAQLLHIDKAIRKELFTPSGYAFIYQIRDGFPAFPQTVRIVFGGSDYPNDRFFYPPSHRVSIRITRFEVNAYFFTHKILYPKKY